MSLEQERQRDTWRTPRSLTCLFDVPPERVAALREDLARAGDDVVGTAGLDLDGMATLQSFRLHLVEDPDGEHAPLLLLNSVFDGELDEHLERLREHAGEWLAALLCAHGVADVTADTLAGALLARRVGEDAIYLGMVGCARADTLAESRLREVLSELADEQRAAGEWGPGTPAETLRADMREHVLALDDPELPRSRASGPTIVERLRRALDALRAFGSPFSGVLHGEIRRALIPADDPPPIWKRAPLELALAIHWLWTAVPTAMILAYVRQIEAAETFERAQVDPEAVRALRRREDQRLQNPLSACTPVVDTPGRHWLLRKVVEGAEDASRHVWNRGRLAGIDTIHVARILRFDGDRRMLFISDYDGSWERYLVDFLGLGSAAVVPLFSNMRGCPPTHELFGTTPGFAPRFLDFTRRYQNPVELWYSAWPELSMPNRLSNRRLRDGLFAPGMSEERAMAWLKELG